MLMNETNFFSLLWPEPAGDARIVRDAEPAYAADIGLDELTAAFSIGRKYDKFVKSVLTGLCMDREIIEYRQDIVDDFRRNDPLTLDMAALLPMIEELAASRETVSLHTSPLLQAVRRFGELELYVECVDALSGALTRCGERLKSGGLLRLKQKIEEIASTESFQTLKVKIPELKSGMEHMTSVTIGVNLDAQLRPVEATILSVNDTRFKGSPFLNTLFTRGRQPSPSTGIAELHSVAEQAAYSDQDKVKQALKEDQALQIMLFNDLHAILNRSLAPIVAAMKRYSNIKSQFIIGLEYDIAFFLGAASLARRLEANGLPMCRPVMTDGKRRVFSACGSYNLNLADRMIAGGRMDASASIVTNDIEFDSGGTVFVLTGPNRGGKTTYLQSVAILQLLAQAGVPVPAVSAELSPADGIFTHFPVEERPGENSGRLGEEARRLAEIFRTATSESLILLNESIASSSPSENLQISRDVLLGLKLMGVRAIFATHLHELAEGLEEMNVRHTHGGRAVSLLAGAEEVKGERREYRRTFKVVRANPTGTSYAADIAEKYGLGREQILRTLRDRKLLEENGIC